MPIKSLTNRQPQFPEIGQLRKGAEKPERGPGRDLDHFRFTSDIEEVQTTFDEHYNGKPRLVNVFLPFAYVDENWEAWNEHWVAGGLKHRCDGEFVVRMQYNDGTYIDPEPGTEPCPGNCSPSGRLKVIIPELKRLAYVTVLTSSINDIVNLDSQLRALQSVSADLRGVPLQLRRRKKSISTPGTKGKRARRDSWLLSIEAAPSWVELQLAAQEAAAIPQLSQPDAPAVPDGAVIVNGITGEVLGAKGNGPDWDDVPDQDEEPDEGAKPESKAKPMPQPEPKSEIGKMAKAQMDHMLGSEAATNGRPLDAETVRSTIRTKAKWQNDDLRLVGEPVTKTQQGVVTRLLDTALGYYPDGEMRDKLRYQVYGYLVGVDTSAKLTKLEASAMIDWLKVEEEGDWTINGYAQAEVISIIAAISTEEQPELMNF